MKFMRNPIVKESVVTTSSLCSSREVAAMMLCPNCCTIRKSDPRPRVRVQEIRDQGHMNQKACPLYLDKEIEIR